MGLGSGAKCPCARARRTGPDRAQNEVATFSSVALAI
jgi:hypothetical protein